MVCAKPALNSFPKARFPVTRTANFGPAKAQTSLWLSTDPAMGEYIPGAPINDKVREQNENPPGMGRGKSYNPVDANGDAKTLRHYHTNTVLQNRIPHSIRHKDMENPLW
jgi:hypothetical protein